MQKVSVVTILGEMQKSLIKTQADPNYFAFEAVGSEIFLHF